MTDYGIRAKWSRKVAAPVAAVLVGLANPDYGGAGYSKRLAKML